MYYVYMIRCKDNSIYTGITTDIKRRWEEHLLQNEKCAKYTKNHQVVKIEAIWQTENRKYASKLEYRIKELTKLQKENLIKTKELSFLKEELIDKYQVIKKEKF